MSYWTYYHDLSPFIWRLSGNFGLRWYSLAYILGAAGGWFFARRLILKGRLNIPLDRLTDIVTVGAFGAVAGGRLGYCLFYANYLFSDFSASFPFWGVLKIHEGGMSSHGGFLGLFLSFLIYARRQKISFFSLMDLSAPGGAFGIALGRIANFINGELFGNVIEGRALLGVKFPQELLLWSGYIGQYKERLLSLKKALPALKSHAAATGTANGTADGTAENASAAAAKAGDSLPAPGAWENWLNLAVEDTHYKQKVSATAQQFYEASHSEPVMKALEPLLSLRHPSQLYQSFFGGMMTLLIVYLLWLKPRKAGLVSCVWAASYLIFRVGTETFRAPDPFMGYRAGGLTQGQLLSLSGLLLAGLYGFLVYRQKNP